MDNRDWWRTLGSTFKGLIYMGFLGATIWGTWYFAVHMEDIIKMATQEASKAALEASKTGSDDFMKQMQKMLKK
ncbi:hypothetical protein EXS70_04990 [Candidatus Peribacteria bacterium]|nr:hypothetical protein [Candidatus Peribacteria bacterium]